MVPGNIEAGNKVLDVIVKISSCNTCRSLSEKKKMGELSEFEYLEKYTDHEPTCEKKMKVLHHL